MLSNSRNGRVVPAAILLGVASLLSRIVGLLRERVLTTTFGAGDVFDAFVAAFRLPDLIFNLIVLGALSAAFIPLFTDKLIKSPSDGKVAFDFALKVLNVIIVLVVVFSAIFAIFAPVIVPIMTPGFTGEKLEMTIMLSRIMALQPILLGISFVFSGILNSFKRFVAYAMAPILYNIGIILGVWVLVPRIGISGLAWGVVLGAALHMFIQLPSVINAGLRYRPTWSWLSNDMKMLWRMMVPRVVGLAAVQVNLLTVTVIGSTLLAGSITAFHLANNVQHLPVGVFGIAFAQAAFPTLAEQISRGQRDKFKNTLTRSFRYILFLVIPVSVIMFLLREPTIRILFGDGAFDWDDTVLTFQTLGGLTLSIFAQATIPLLARAFYVDKDTKTPVIISIVSMVVNVLLAIWLAPVYGVIGLAVAFSVSAILNMSLLLGVLYFRLRGFNSRTVLRSLLRIIAASLVAAIAVQLIRDNIVLLVDMQRVWGVFLQLFVSGAIGIGVYLLVAWMLKSDELIVLKKYFPTKKPDLELPTGTETTRFEGLSD